MRRFSCFAIVMATLSVYCASYGFAKGGGGGHGGGGHSGGEHHSSSEHHGEEHHSEEHHNAEHHADDHHDGHNDHHDVAHHGDHHAYDHDWHHYHPGAWGWGDGGYAWGNPWAPATYATAANWLSVHAQTTEVTEDNVQPETIYPAATAEEQPSDPSSLAASGTAEPAADAKFMPLGVFTIAPKGDLEAVAIVQLAISKEGLVRGTAYNFRLNQDRNIQGAVNKKDRTVAWTVGDATRVYHTTLDALTDPPGSLTIQFENGRSREWTIARFNKEDESRSFEDAKKRLQTQQQTSQIDLGR